MPMVHKANYLGLGVLYQWPAGGLAGFTDWPRVLGREPGLFCLFPKLLTFGNRPDRQTLQLQM